MERWHRRAGIWADLRLSCLQYKEVKKGIPRRENSINYKAMLRQVIGNITRMGETY